MTEVNTTCMINLPSLHSVAIEIVSPVLPIYRALYIPQQNRPLDYHTSIAGPSCYSLNLSSLFHSFIHFPLFQISLLTRDSPLWLLIITRANTTQHTNVIREKNKPESIYGYPVAEDTRSCALILEAHRKQCAHHVPLKQNVPALGPGIYYTYPSIPDSLVFIMYRNMSKVWNMLFLPWIQKKAEQLRSVWQDKHDHLAFSVSLWLILVLN